MANEEVMNQAETQMAWDDLRTSPAFPAIIGGVAGALGGVALMFIFNRLSKPKQTLPAAYDTNGDPMNIVYLPQPEQFRILGFTVGDILTLATVGLSLYRQIQDMAASSQAETDALSVPPAPVLPPSPAEMPKPAVKK